MSNFRTRIVIVDNNEDARRKHLLVLSSRKNCLVINTYSSAEKAIKNLKKDLPDIVFMDLDLPEMDGITGIKKIKRLSSRTKIIVITKHKEKSTVFGALMAGASGYIIKNSNPFELIQAVEQLINGGAPLSPQVAKVVVGSFHKSSDTPLSNRETEVLSLLSTGKTYKIAAKELYVGMETIKSHVKNIYSKLQTNTKSGALEIARRDNLI